MTTEAPRKHFSMIREFHLADWFTLANAVCGTGALFSVMTYLKARDVRHVYFACALVLAALVFDVIDGRIARQALVALLALAARSGAVGESLWLGVVRLAGFDLHPLVLAFALSGSLMISRIRIPKP